MQSLSALSFNVHATRRTDMRLVTHLFKFYMSSGAVQASS